MRMRLAEGRTGEAARAVLPPEGIGFKVRVQLGVPIVFQAPLPRQQQVLHQERGADHAHPVVHPASGPQLAHCSVNKRVASPTLPPSLRCKTVLGDLQMRKVEEAAQN